MPKSLIGHTWHLSRSNRRFLAIAIWMLGLCLMAVLSIWNISNFRQDAESRLISEAGRTAAQLASLLTLPGIELDTNSARAVVAGAMEDDHIYAVKVQTPTGVIAGERRNYLWEPVPWDDEIAENCVQGTSPIRIDGHIAGSVDVWLSPRVNEEENTILSKRETWRYIIFSILWTGVLLLLFWQWGDFRRLHRFLSGKATEALENNETSEDLFAAHALSRNSFYSSPNSEEQTDTERQDNDSQANSYEDQCKIPSERSDMTIVDADSGMRYQRRNAEAWFVTAGMFRQTFARGPALISRLYAEGEIAGLCHLGRILEQAAPCIGAQKLVCAARDMQAALNDPNCQASAIPVEECARALEEVLEALCGNGQWRSKPGNARS